MQSILSELNRLPMRHRAAVVSMFRKGPPPTEGWTWCDAADPYWTPEESSALHYVNCLMLRHGYEGVGYAYMMRELEHTFK